MAMHKFLEAKVGQYVTGEPVVVPPTMSLRDLEALFSRHDFNAFPVVEGGRMVGIVTKLDFLKAFKFTTAQLVPHYDDIMRREVAKVMTRAVVHVSPDAPLTRALELMIEKSARSFPVLTEAGTLVGVIAREDLMRALRETVAAAR